MRDAPNQATIESSPRTTTLLPALVPQTVVSKTRRAPRSLAIAGDVSDRTSVRQRETTGNAARAPRTDLDSIFKCWRDGNMAMLWCAAVLAHQTLATPGGSDAAPSCYAWVGRRRSWGPRARLSGRRRRQRVPSGRAGRALSTTVHTAIVDGEARGRGVEGGPFFAVVPRPLSVPRGSLDNMRAGREGSRARN